MFNWFWEFLYGLVKVAFYCIDFILDIAKMLCGIDPVTVTKDGRSQETDILYHFLSSEEITNAFIIVAAVGFILLFLFTAFSILRSQVKDGEEKSPARICFESAKALLYFFMVPGIMLLGCVFVSAVMRSVFEATSLGEGSLGASLFAIMAEEAYDGTGNVQTVLDSFISGEYDYYNTSTVQQYFDLSEMNYFLGFVGGVAILVLLALSMLAFVDRVISLVVLFVISPLSMSTAALDDGARFKLWRDQVINKFLTAFGALICLNVFVLMMSVINEIKFFDNSFMNSLARLFFTIGGAFACYKGTALVGNLINSGAGSQELSDTAHANSMFGRVSRLAASGAMGLLRGASKPVAKPIAAAGASIGNKVSSAIHRDGNAKREAKAMLARDRYMEKFSAGSGKQQKEIQEQLRAGGRGANADAARQSGDQSGQNPVQQAAAGGGSAGGDNGNHETLNKNASDTIAKAMPTRKNNGNADNANHLN